VLDKTDLTHQILALIKDSCDLKAGTALSQWWVDFRPTGGMRLTDDGYKIFSSMLELESWRFAVGTDVLQPRNLILLDRKMRFPYYLQRARRQHWLHMFGDKEAMMATLYGDIEQWLKSLEKA
jgi:hypothetical protein